MDLNRRQLLTAAVAAGSVVVLPRLLHADDGAAAGKRAVVLLHLRGGNDGLNTVIPYAHPRYRALRPTLGIDRSQVRKIDAALGLHPALAGFEAQWRKERLAIVNGVGYPQPDFSHFRSTEIWYTGRPERTSTHGWAGRALASAPRTAPIRAVALDREPPQSLHGAGPGIATFRDFKRFQVPAELRRVRQLYEAYREDAGMRGDLGEAGAAALDVAERISKLEPVSGPYRGGLGDDLRRVLALLESDLGIEVIHLAFDGFDTHANQRDAHRNLLSALGDNLDAYQDRLAQRGLAERVVTVVFSEFGRRATENLSAGTDHGTAGPVFVLGAGLQPGFHGSAPDLDDLVQENLRFTTDFRHIYAAVLKDAMDLDPAPLVGDFPPLELFS
ncbi:MAG: DUF1501 domain-containing protein [Planctomycetota bacterium]|jgi:uncharacterized protein (DUF1501 family)